MVSSRRLKAAGMRVGLTVFAGISLSACAGLSSLPLGDAPRPAQTAPIESSELDPLNAPTMAGSPAEDPLLVAPSEAAMFSDEGSRRVPLGTLANSSSSASVSPVEPAARPPNPVNSTPPASVLPASRPPEAGSNQAVTTPEPPADAQLAAAPVPPAQPEPEPRSVTSPPRLHSDRPVGRGPKPLYENGSAPVADVDETVIISSESPVPEMTAREFIPATALPPVPQDAAPALGQIPLTAAEKNTVRRFETLRRLQGEDLITQQEFSRRRAANIGALLPYTHDPAAVGLGRSVPGTDAIVARLAALKRAFEMRAITAQQHALERTMILNALLPEVPSQRDNPKPPPADVLAGAAMVGQLEDLRQSGLITASELKAEQEAIEYMLRTGTVPTRENVTASTPRATPSQASKASAPAATQQEAVSSQITGPVLHIASFRSEASALRGWDEVLAANRETLGALQPIVRRVDLGPDQGIFYRLMAGTFASVAEAEATCIQLKQNNQFCRASADGS